MFCWPMGRSLNKIADVYFSQLITCYTHINNTAPGLLHKVSFLTAVHLTILLKFSLLLSVFTHIHITVAAHLFLIRNAACSVSTRISARSRSRLVVELCLCTGIIPIRAGTPLGPVAGFHATPGTRACAAPVDLHDGGSQGAEEEEEG